MKNVDKYRKIKISDCDIKNLFLSLGCLVVNKYPQIILEHDERLASKIKKYLTLVINNLQTCGQLKTRIIGLKEGYEEANNKLNNTNYSNQKKQKLKEQRDRFKDSLVLKKERLGQLNQENIAALLKIGKWFYQEKLLEEKEEFQQLYIRLDFLVSEQEEQNNKQNNNESWIVDNLDERCVNLT
ncbi:MAG: hypothetical protein ACQERJ_09015 [Bacillota bacterium]